MMKKLLDHDITIFRISQRRVGCVTVSLQYDLGSLGNIVSASFLNKFERSASTLSRPSIGGSVNLTLAHPRHDLRIVFQFVVIANPDSGVIVGDPACNHLQATWSEERIMS